MSKNPSIELSEHAFSKLNTIWSSNAERSIGWLISLKIWVFTKIHSSLERERKAKKNTNDSHIFAGTAGFPFSWRQQHQHQHQLNTTNRLELGASFSSGLPGWFRSCFFVGFIEDFSCTAQISLGFQWSRTNLSRIFGPAVGARDIIFGRPRWPGGGSSRNAGLFRLY